MLAKDLYQLRDTLGASDTLFAYSGYMTEDIRLAVGETLKRQLEMDEADTTTLRSVFAIFVEQMQNVIRYSADQAEGEAMSGASTPLSSGILTIGREDGRYVVLSGNLVLREDAARVAGHVGELGQMDKAALKAFYKEKLRAGPDETSKGAGIGLIEIARRATEPLEHDVHDVDEKQAFFALKATI